MKKFALIISLFAFISSSAFSQSEEFKLGADRIDALIPLLENKRVALVSNQTSILSDGTHLLDALLIQGVNIKKIFAPEFGFRGDVAAGQFIANDEEEGIPIISLYGANYKPTTKQLADVDVVIFDLQDVGVRFFSHLSTLHYVMDACSQNVKELIILDRPNPNDFVDGPVLDMSYQSFVGLHPIPVLHGMTFGELAQMINGEGWLPNKRQTKLQVVELQGWEHGEPYMLPVAPAPFLPNQQSVLLYPSLSLLESAAISIGIGTSAPFQVIGGSEPEYGSFTFTPRASIGFETPMLAGVRCYGIDLRELPLYGGISLSFVLDFYHRSNLGKRFFTNARFLDLLAGNKSLREGIESGRDETHIRYEWIEGLKKYRETRSKYLIYPEIYIEENSAENQ